MLNKMSQIFFECITFMKNHKTRVQIQENNLVMAEDQMDYKGARVTSNCNENAGHVEDMT